MLFPIAASHLSLHPPPPHCRKEEDAAPASRSKKAVKAAPKKAVKAAPKAKKATSFAIKSSKKEYVPPSKAGLRGKFNPFNTGVHFETVSTTTNCHNQ